MLDSILINTPVSSPIHPQANLPLLKGHLEAAGFKSRVIDSNILFYSWFLREKEPQLCMEEVYDNPLKILSYYGDIEKRLWKRSQDYEGLDLGLRYVSMANYDRTEFGSVMASLEDAKANPFIEYYNQLIDGEIVESGAKILAIAITFQDQLISAFTLASLLRKKMPQAKIVLGGQMITRCYNTLVEHDGLRQFYDYLGLWEGEELLTEIHKKEINGEKVLLTNVIEVGVDPHPIDRESEAPASDAIPFPDFTDLNFRDYFFPDMLVPLQTTRGCYAKCEFCAIPFGANSYRVRPADKVIEDILKIQKHTEEKYGSKATFFKFMEDTSSPSLLFDVSIEIERQGLDVKWETFARLEKKFSEPGFMDQLYRGGCRKIHWGLETNDPDVLRNMNKKVPPSYADIVLENADAAGILNFCFILLGFPGETDESRQNMIDYIVKTKSIHTITITTFDLTRGAPMEQDFDDGNPYLMDMLPAEGFQVRLPYTVNGENWKAMIVPWAHKMMLEVVKKRPDIGFMTLFPDQIRSLYCDKYTNKWGQIFCDKYGEANIKEMLVNTEAYAKAYESQREIDPALLPEPLRREHFRTKEDMAMIASAVMTRKSYEGRRMRQV